MYYKTRKVMIDRMAHVLKLEIADSNVTPIQYRWTEYDKEGNDIKEKLRKFFISCIDGNYKLLSSCGMEKVIVNAARKLYDVATEEIPFREIDLSTDQEIKEAIVSNYCVPRAMLSKWKDEQEMMNMMRAYNQKLKAKASEKEDKLKSEGKNSH